MNATELRSLLERLGISPNRKLGQSFLVDENLARWIVDQLRPEPEDVVIEVGPGAGALTEWLAGQVRRLILVEFDRGLAENLRNTLGQRPGVEVVEADAVGYDLRPLFAEGPVKFIGNLPYSSGTAILQTFLDNPSPVAEAVVMLQQEVADRIAAEPRTKDYGKLSLQIQSRWTVRRLKTMGPEGFWPRPQVDSTVIHLKPRDRRELPAFDEKLFGSLVKRGFAQRRKQLRKNLNVEHECWATITRELDLPETVRAEEMSLKQWVDLVMRLDEHPLSAHPQSGEELFDVVDEQNQVVEQRPRAEVHRDKLIHRATHIFVFNSKGELFLQKRSQLKDSSPGKWDSSAAGHLDVGEPYEAAALRELEEELGISGVPVEKLALLTPSANTGWEFVELFRAEYSGKVRWPGAEIETGAFFPVAVLDDWVARRPGDFASGFVECWKVYRGNEDSGGNLGR